MKKYLAGMMCLILMLSLHPASLAEEYQEAVIANPVITDRLNLRKSPSPQSDTIGRFYTGTPVAVLSLEGEWAKVRMHRLEGYMMKEFLYMEREGVTVPCYFYEASTVGTVSLKAEPKNQGEEIAKISGQVYILGDIGDDWRYIRQGLHFGYVKTSQLENHENTIATAYIHPQDGSSVAGLYSDSGLKKRVGLIYAGAQVTVLDMSRAGWAKVQIKNGENTYREETFYVHPGDINPFFDLEEIPQQQKTGILLKNYTVNQGGRQLALPEGALCTLTVNFSDTHWLIEYGPENNLLLKVPQSVIGYQDRTVGRMGLAGNGYAFITDAASDIRPSAAPDKEAIDPEGITVIRKTIEGWKTLEYLGTVQGKEQPWHQARNYFSQGYLPAGQVRVLENEAMYPRIQDAYLAPGQHIFDDQSCGLYHFIAEEGETPTLVLKNEDWNLDQQFTISNAQYTVHIPAGTRAVLEGGGRLRPAEEGQWQLSVTPENPRFEGDGRFFVPEELTPGLWWDYQISPLDPNKESYYVISSLNTLEGQEIRVDLSDYSPEKWDDYIVWIELQPGCFLEVHNCLVELYWGNG